MTPYAVAGGVLLLYVASLYLHPSRPCTTCGGRGRHTGAVFTAAYRPCHACAGAGGRRRFGAWMLGLYPRPGRRTAGPRR